MWSQKHKCLQRQFLPGQGPPQLVCSGAHSSGAWGRGEGFFSTSSRVQLKAADGPVQTFLFETLGFARL